MRALAYLETTVRVFQKQVVLSNLLGCVAFMVSAVLAVSLPGTSSSEAVTVSVLFTLLGAIGFLVGSLLMLPEAISQPEP